ncbi:50S ribosomal protein L10 [Candidatus Daviesbacteria bacterium]|nr:50S ribosomal protein L10 [Candidatus Daviesbacteria bacterium]
MPKTRAQKIESVTKLQEKLTRAKALVFADYKGMTMKQLSDLRNKLREQNAEFNITKNTLLQRSIENCKLKISGASLSKDRSVENSLLDGPTATLFAYDDEITPIKILVKTFKDNELGKVLGGFLGSDALSASKVTQLSSLPGKNELRGQVVGVLAAPLKGIVGVLQGNLRNLVYALSEIQKKKGGEQ